MTAAASDTLAALLEAIRADPDDDTVRLALADWYEENGDPARAEFIRVQVELARVGMRECTNAWCTRFNKRVPMDWCVKCLEWNDVRQPLQARSDALRAEHEARWRRGGKCPECHGAKRMLAACTADEVEYEKRTGRRFFPPMIDCPTCRGTGWERWWLAGVGIAFSWHHRVHWERGFPVQVDANLRDIMDADGNPTEWALAVVRGEPGLRRLWPVDKKPLWNEDRSTCTWSLPYPGTLVANESWELPWFIFRHLPHKYARWIRDRVHHYEEESAANRAIAEAVYRVVEGAVSGS